MKEQRKNYKIFCLANSIMSTELLSLKGSKYDKALSFDFEFSPHLNDCSIIAWDGIISSRMNIEIKRVIEFLRNGKILLLLGESYSLFKNSSSVELMPLENLNIVELTGWTVLPEDLLDALEKCHQKLSHV
jgi:hypothetical protein